MQQSYVHLQNNWNKTVVFKVRGLHDKDNIIGRYSLLCCITGQGKGAITLVNTQNVSVSKIVDSSSIQCAESK